MYGINNNDMINWEINNEPLSNKRVAIQLPDGRVCSGMVNDKGGFNLEYVDNLDLLSYMVADEQKWIYLDE